MNYTKSQGRFFYYKSHFIFLSKKNQEIYHNLEEIHVTHLFLSHFLTHRVYFLFTDNPCIALYRKKTLQPFLLFTFCTIVKWSILHVLTTKLVKTLLYVQLITGQSFMYLQQNL